MLETIINWIKRLSLKTKLVLVGIISFVGFIFFTLIQSKMNLKSSYKYQLSKLKSEIELKRLEGESDEIEQELLKLEEQEREVTNRIKIIEERELKGEDISIEELDRFFDERGF